MQKFWGRREFGDQKEGEWGQTEWSTRRLSKKSQRDGARYTASEVLGQSLGFISSTMGSQGEDFKHRGDMI